MVVVRAVLVAITLIPIGAVIPGHAKFNFVQGVMSSSQDPKLRINAAGGYLTAGDPLVLWPCSPHANELFLFEDGLIKLQSDPSLCLNAEGGAGAGSPIITYPCEHNGTRTEHEGFLLDDDGRIRLSRKPIMCLNIEAGSMAASSRVILYPCSDGSSPPQPNEAFEHDGSLIKLRAAPELHFNVQGGVLEANKNIVLWGCQAATHEVFEFSADGKLRLFAKKELCVNAEGGLRSGNRLIVYPCSEEQQPNEQWEYDPDYKVIRSTERTELGFNVKEAEIKAGAEIVLWHLDHEEL